MRNVHACRSTVQSTHLVGTRAPHLVFSLIRPKPHRLLCTGSKVQVVLYIIFANDDDGMKEQDFHFDG